jgi:hypothetical protein
LEGHDDSIDLRLSDGRESMPDQDAFRALTLAGPRRHSLAVWIWSALLIADAVLATRRLSGQFTEPLPAPLATFSGLIVAITSLAAWSVYVSVPRPQTTKLLSLAPQAVSLTITAVWCWALSAATSPLAAGMLFSIVLLQLGVLAASSDLVWSEASPRISHPEPLTVPEVNTPVTPPTAESTFSVQSDEPFVEEIEFTDEGAGEIDEGQTLWLSRRTTEDTEQIEGWVRVEFAAGQREAVVHVAFCPPLPGIPEIETEDLEGSDLEIRVAAAFAFGTRLSVRRSGSLDESTTDRVGFFAQARAANRAA